MEQEEVLWKRRGYGCDGEKRKARERERGEVWLKV